MIHENKPTANTEDDYLKVEDRIALHVIATLAMEGFFTYGNLHREGDTLQLMVQYIGKAVREGVQACSGDLVDILREVQS